MEADCRQILADLATYLDGECHRDLDALISRHLSDCPPCVDRADFERELRALVASRCRDAAPSGLAGQVLARLRQELA